MPLWVKRSGKKLAVERARNDQHGTDTSQAEDRSHRLGQERPVTIYRMITDATVDADILSIAQVRTSVVLRVCRTSNCCEDITCSLAVCY